MEGYVAFLDIIGFSELIKESTFDQKFEKYSRILRKTTQTNNRDLQHITFSDSVIINTKEGDEQNLLNLIWAIAEINFRLLTELDIPICGSVSKGPFSRYEDRKNGNVIIAGAPIIDAYRYEQRQDWIGVMLSPTVLRDNPNLFIYGQLKPPSDESEVKEIRSYFPWPLLIQRFHAIPFKKLNDFDDQYYNGFVIVPQRYGCQEPAELIKDLDDYKNRLDPLMAFASEPDQQNKYRETARWIEEVKNYWSDVSNRRVWLESHES